MTRSEAHVSEVSKGQPGGTENLTVPSQDLLRKVCGQHSHPVQASLHPLSLVENSTQNKYGKWLLSTFMGSGTDNRVDSWSHLTFSLIVLWTISR